MDEPRQRIPWDELLQQLHELRRRAVAAWRIAARTDWNTVQPFTTGVRNRARNETMLRARIFERATLRAAGARGGISAERLRQIEARSAMNWMHHADAAWHAAYYALRPDIGPWPCPKCPDGHDITH